LVDATTIHARAHTRRLAHTHAQAEADTGNIGGSLSHEYQLVASGAPPGAPTAIELPLTSVCVCLSVCLSVCLYIYVCMYVCVCACVRVCARLSLSLSLSVWMCGAGAPVGEDELLQCDCGAYASNVECATGRLPFAAAATPVDAAGEPVEVLVRRVLAARNLRYEQVVWPTPVPPPATAPAGTAAPQTLLVLADDRRGNAFKLKRRRPAWAVPYGEPALQAVPAPAPTDRVALLVDESVLARLPASVPAPTDTPAVVLEAVGDFRLAAEGDRCPRTGTTAACPSGALRTTRGIEVGHAFYLGDKYSAPVRGGSA
jgi:prolyl-tRNA synthetase